MKNLVIIIRGPLGVGKTTIAKNITKKLRAKYISIDKILSDHALDQSVGGGIPVRNFLGANEYVVTQITPVLHFQNVVIDGNFYYKEALDDLKNKIFQKIFVFTLKADVKTCLQRDAHRQKSYGRDAVKYIHSMINKFKYGTAIDTKNKTVSEVADEILKKIRKFE